MAEIKKGSYERCIQVGRVLERKQFICDGALEDEFQSIKPKKKSKNCRIKDNVMLALISRYDGDELTREQYGRAYQDSSGVGKHIALRTFEKSFIVGGNKFL